VRGEDTGTNKATLIHRKRFPPALTCHGFPQGKAYKKITESLHSSQGLGK